MLKELSDSEQTGRQTFTSKDKEKKVLNGPRHGPYFPEASETIVIHLVLCG